MKKLTLNSLFLLIIAVTILLLPACKKQKKGCRDFAASNYDATADIDDGSCIQNFFATVDGVPFKGIGKTHYPGGNRLLITAFDESNGNHQTISIEINVYAPNNLDTNTYPIWDYAGNQLWYCSNCSSGATASTDVNHTGTLKVTNIYNNYIISGTFNATLNDFTNGGIITISNGSFKDIYL